MIYFFQIIFVFVMGSIFYKEQEPNNSKSNNIFIASVFSLFAIIIAFRDISVGTDTRNYSNLYVLVGWLSWEEVLSNVGMTKYYLDIGWAILTKIFSTLSFGYYAFQFIYAIVYMCLSANFIKKLSSNAFVATILFMGLDMLYYPTNIQRQSLAVVILINGWILLKEKKVFKSFICYFIASTLHFSAIIFVIPYIIYLFKNSKLIKLMPYAAIIICFSYEFFLDLFSNIFTQYRKYITRNAHLANVNGGIIIWVIIAAIVVYSIYINKSADGDYKICCILSLVFIACNIIGMYFNYFERFRIYFIPFVILLFSEFSKYLEKRTKTFYYSGLTICFAILYLISNSKSTDRLYLSYIFK